VQAEEEFEGFIPQSESKLNYSGTKDHPGTNYVDHDEPTLFDKREQRANVWIRGMKLLASSMQWRRYG
jgi:hypothetical protein